MLCLSILYEDGSRMPLSLAKIHDRHLLTHAARLAIKEADDLAVALEGEDQVLSAVQAEEALKVGRVLRMLLPGLESKSATNATVQ